MAAEQLWAPCFHGTDWKTRRAERRYLRRFPPLDRMLHRLVALSYYDVKIYGDQWVGVAIHAADHEEPSLWVEGDTVHLCVARAWERLTELDWRLDEGGTMRSQEGGLEP